MKKDFSALLFYIFYSAASAIFLLSFYIAGFLSMEIFAYAIWVYLFYFLIGLPAFFLLSLFTRRVSLSAKYFYSVCAVLCLLILNSIPLIEEKRFLTKEVIANLYKDESTDFTNLVIHLNAVLSFIVSYLCLRFGLGLRKKK